MKHSRRKNRRSRSTVQRIGHPVPGALLVLTLAQVPRLQRGYVVCVRNTKCVSGTNRVSDTHIPIYINHLHNVCQVCQVCQLFSSSYLSVFQNSFFFYKLNFNLKLPDTLDTHLYNPHAILTFLSKVPDTHR